MRRLVLALLLVAACGADEASSDGTAFCEFADELTAERPEDYVGSAEHVEDVRELARLAPPILRADAEHFRDFVEAGIDSPDTEDWPADVQASVQELRDGIEARCR